MIRAEAFTKGFELDRILNFSKDPLLEFLFNGGVIKGKRLKKGNVLIFSDVAQQKEDKEKRENPNTPSTEEIMRMYETVYIF
jgi:hypothetical protein